MTIDEIIADCEEIMLAAEMMKQAEVYKYNKQLAEWLRELKTYREADKYNEEDDFEEAELLTADERADVLNAMNEMFEEKGFNLEVAMYEDIDGYFFTVSFQRRLSFQRSSSEEGGDEDDE